VGGRRCVLASCPCTPARANTRERACLHPRSARNALAVPAEWRLLLTGTPVQNNVAELTALLRFLLPDAFLSVSLLRDGPQFSVPVADTGDEGDWEDATTDGADSRMAALAAAVQREVDRIVTDKPAAGSGAAATTGFLQVGAVWESCAVRGGGDGGECMAPGVGRRWARGLLQHTAPPNFALTPPSSPSCAQNVMSALILRRTKASAHIALPPKTQEVHWIVPDGAQQAILDTLSAVVHTFAPASLLATALSAARNHGAVPSIGVDVDAAGGGGGKPTLFTLPSRLVLVGDLSRILRVGGDDRDSDAVMTSGSGGHAGGVMVQLAAMLMLLRKASIHPMLTRAAYSTASVLSLVPWVYAADYDAAHTPAQLPSPPVWPPPSFTPSTRTAPAATMAELAVTVGQPDLVAWSCGHTKLAQLAEHMLAMSVSVRQAACLRTSPHAPPPPPPPPPGPLPSSAGAGLRAAQPVWQAGIHGAPADGLPPAHPRATVGHQGAAPADHRGRVRGETQWKAGRRVRERGFDGCTRTPALAPTAGGRCADGR
jgi:hypothetical protein